MYVQINGNEIYIYVFILYLNIMNNGWIKFTYCNKKYTVKHLPMKQIQQFFEKCV